MSNDNESDDQDESHRYDHHHGYHLVGNTEAKLHKHDGIYTRSYLVARATYDAAIRSWHIEFQDNLFIVTNNEGVIETVYYEIGTIENCSCAGFAETECGTCMHIEAIRRLDPIKIQRVRVRPITFVNNEGVIKTSGKPFVYETPSIRPVTLLNESRRLPYNDMELGDVDVFKEFGINLFDFQKESIPLMIRNIRTILTLPMGLGKTLCALACCKILNKKKILIVTPNSLKYQWQEQIERFNLGSSLVASKSVDLCFYRDQRFLIMSYQMMNSNRWLLEQQFDILIPDEIQTIRNQESVSWETMSGIKTEYIFALSGTPIQNNINDLLALINFLNPSEFKPEWKFYEGFCNYTRAKIFGIHADRIKDFKKRIDRYLVSPTIDYSRFKMPVKKEVVIRTKLDSIQKDRHDGNLKIAQTLIAKGMNTPLSFAERMMLNGLLTKARIAATDARLVDPEASKSEKFEQVEQLLLKLTGDGEKVIVYSEWIRSLDLLIPTLESYGIEYVVHNGNSSAKKRNKELLRFIRDDSVKVFLSTDTGGLGVDGLQLVSHNVIHLERMWNPMKLEQRNGRLIRTLQRAEEVTVYYFVTDAGVETLISASNDRKYSLISDVLKAI